MQIKLVVVVVVVVGHDPGTMNFLSVRTASLKKIYHAFFSYDETCIFISVTKTVELESLGNTT